MSKRTSHTPGPWKIQRHSMVDKSFMVGPAEIDYDDVDHAEQNANGRLISAAPDLLAACHDALHALTLSESCQDEITAVEGRIRAAIAKAEGRSLSADVAAGAKAAGMREGGIS